MYSIFQQSGQNRTLAKLQAAAIQVVGNNLLQIRRTPGRQTLHRERIAPRAGGRKPVHRPSMLTQEVPAQEVADTSTGEATVLVLGQDSVEREQALHHAGQS